MKTFVLKVWGDYACFTRPEMKVERVSYDVMTPSAARAIFEAILWKPAIEWVVTKIEVLNPIKQTSVRRNELGSVISTRNAITCMNNGTGKLGMYIEEDRQQRAALLLRDVSYRIHAHFRIKANAGENNNAGKFLDMFERRAEKGQCHYQPYLGCREFSAYFSLENPAQTLSAPLAENRDLGWMLYDMNYAGAIAMPIFFRAELKNGVLDVPAPNSQEIRA